MWVLDLIEVPSEVDPEYLNIDYDEVYKAAKNRLWFITSDVQVQAAEKAVSKVALTSMLGKEVPSTISLVGGTSFNVLHNIREASEITYSFLNKEKEQFSNTMEILKSAIDFTTSDSLHDVIEGESTSPINLMYFKGITSHLKDLTKYLQYGSGATFMNSSVISTLVSGSDLILPTWKQLRAAITFMDNPDVLDEGCLSIREIRSFFSTCLTSTTEKKLDDLRVVPILTWVELIRK